MKSKISVRIDCHAPDGTRVHKFTGTGVIALIMQGTGDTLIRSAGEYNEINAMGVCLQYFAKAFDEQPNQDIRLMMANALDGMTNLFKTTADTMHEQLDGAPVKPVTPFN